MRKIFLSVVIFFFIFPSIVYSKTYSISDVNIDCTVLKDTRIRWLENRTFQFQGDYSFGYYDLPMYGYDYIREIQVSEKGVPYSLNESEQTGTFWVESFSDYHRIHYYYQAENETRTFDYTYYIEGGLDLYEDYGQFYWKLQGNGWGVPVDHFKTTIHLENPVNKEEIKAWAHGPLQGEILIVDGSTILLEVTDIPAYTFIEVRLLVPASYFSTEPTETGSISSITLEEEAKWVQEANAVRTRQIKLHRWRTFWRWFWNILVYGTALFLLIYVIFLYKKYGVEYSSLKRYEYLREPPDIPPAEIGYLIKFNELHPNTVQAILLDLIRRKYIRQKVGDGNTISKDDIELIQEEENGIEPLKSYEQTLLFEILFRDQSYTNQSSTSVKKLKKAMRQSPFKFYPPVEKFKRELAEEVKKQDFFDLKSQQMSEFVIALCAVLLAFLIIFGFSMPKKYVYLLPVLIVFFWLIGNMGITRRSKKGKELYDQCMAFKKFLKDFTQLNTMESNSVIIWEKYLVYGVILGVSENVIRALQVKLDLMDTSHSNLLSLKGTNWSNSMLRLTTSTMAIGSTVSHITRPSSSSGSYSGSSSHFSSFSGGGGGFSGGGGGGGGGSGGGMG